MKIRLIDVDGWNKKRGQRFPNLALMKLAAWHKAQGDDVAWSTGFNADQVYVSKVFTFTPEPKELAGFNCPVIKGGTGFDAAKELLPEVEAMEPDYSLYPEYKPALGFLTRGCIRSCPWCIVPHKEGHIREVGDIEKLAEGRRNAVLMDNNFLAADPGFVREQLEKIARLDLRIDFNQGLDARLVNSDNAPLLAKCRWIRRIRFSCDSRAMLHRVLDAVQLIRGAGYRGEFFCYMLVTENLRDAEQRLRQLVMAGIIPFAQPYRPLEPDPNYDDTAGQREFARFANVKGGKLCLKMKFRDYR